MSRLFLAAAVLAFGASGCQTDAFCFHCEADEGSGGSGPVGAGGDGFLMPPPEDAGPSTGGTGAGGAAACTADTQNDADNCGSCGNRCNITGAFSKCVAGLCEFDRCADGLVDTDGDPTNGCDCSLSNGGTEACDALDNDCDTLVDEDFDTQTNVEHCGACNTPCPDLTAQHASVACVAGICTYTCEATWSNLGQLGVGCPYQCPVNPPLATDEHCDGVDEDCDGIIDDGDPGAGVACHENCPNNSCVGACQPGTTVCTGTAAGVACVGGTRPNPELCDTIDNDCNGQTDEGYNFDSDPLNCGGCNIQCNVNDLCVAGSCNYTCGQYERDLDGLPGNRCEYICPVIPPVAEVCDGIDQDCDGAADNNPTDVGSPCTGNCRTPDPCVATGSCAPYAIAPNNGACYGVCSGNGEISCPSGLRVCRYDAERVDELCNTLDDNCDGRVDEGFNLQLDPENCGACARRCQRPHTLAMTCAAGVCNAVTACEPGFEDLDGLPNNGCEYPCPVFPPVGEACNGIDDDCDGTADDSPSGSGQSCATDCPAAAPCIAAGTCTLTISGNVGSCYGACAADGRTSCAAGAPTCTHPAQDVEACNGLDDDCDGLIDDGFNLLLDRLNCGACGFACALPGASGNACQGGVCRSTGCAPGFANLDNDLTNGCEYACPVFPIQTETCNNRDDDCDGVKDDSPTDAGQPCTGSCPTPNSCVSSSCAPYTIAPQTGGCYGDCRNGGVSACSATGTLVCTYTTVQSAETCNTQDDNCDGRIDDGFNKQTDAQNCGTCGNVCGGANVAARTCAAGVCGVITACTPGFKDLDGNPANGCEYTCPVFPPVGETCNNRDDDCNGTRDDNVVGLGQACTNNCPAPHACVATPATCPGGVVSANTAGCYGVCATDGRTSCPSGSIVCTHVVQGPETCNNQDDNCDGRIDEGFNKQTDVNNCGTCGVVCSLPGAATVRCAAGACEVVTCTPGRANVDLNNANGCEYACPVFPTQPEVCNNIDEDCDGVKDDNPTDVGTACSSNCPGGVCQGVCTTGTFVCITGTRVCQGGGGVQLEVCNNLDDDCNGTVDNGFNKQTDPLNCNACGNVCNLLHVDVHACTTGACRILNNTPTSQLTSCDAGFSNRDNNHANGCEYTCPVFPTRTETCNGVDDDCDGLVDGLDPDLTTPANFCDQDGPCSGSSPQCQGASGWRCNYGPNVDVQANGNVALVEARCDGIDNNCQGQVDETFPLKGTACTAGRGVCSASSTYVCTADTTGVVCPAVAVPGNALNESCDGLDNNCDGFVDERTPVAGTMCGAVPCTGWTDPMVKLGTNNVWIYAYEASRPDANDTNTGSKSDRACSKVNAQPWHSLNYTEAVAACAAAKTQSGAAMRLCTATEWEQACEASLTNTATPLWSYPTAPGTYVGDKCNDRDTLTPNAPWPTGKNGFGADNTCYADWGGASGRVFDMSGNLSEWTNTQSIVPAPPATGGVSYRRVRGGNYQTFPMGTRCDFNFVLQRETFQNFDLGFRCCADSTP